MRTYRVPMVPGPTAVPADVLSAYAFDYGSSDIEPEFFDLYGETQSALQAILRTRNQVAIMSGEGMVALWGALKSCLRPGDKVLAVATGLFGFGVGDMARSLGAEVETVGFPYEGVAEAGPVEAAIVRFRPKMVTMIHCETPSGTLNPVGAVGELVAEHGVPLFYVDAVSSMGGAQLRTDDWHIDLCLGGSQKCFSTPPGVAMVAVSERAWGAIADVGYQGYDALLPWREALASRYFPYTPYWHGIAALEVSCRRILAEGLESVIARHERVAAMCRSGVQSLGLQLFPQHEAYSAPTVTAVNVPEGLTWEELDRRLRRRGVAVGGNYGPLAGKVFRLGHMGTQADERLIAETIAALGEALRAA